MRALTNAEMLEVWELGWQATPAQRAVLLLATAAPELATSEAAEYSIGRRDAQLLELRASVFGRQVVSLTLCPQCGEQVELEFNIDDISAHAVSVESANSAVVIAEDCEVNFRLPNSLDQSAIAQSPNAETALRTLLARCVTSARHAGHEVSPERLPPAALAALTERMAELDPLASVFLTVTCPACQCWWQSLFDIGDFLWRELSAYSQRLLQEVHRLASAYGWSEAEILSLSAGRRQLYLELVNQ